MGSVSGGSLSVSSAEVSVSVVSGDSVCDGCASWEVCGLCVSSSLGIVTGMLSVVSSSTKYFSARGLATAKLTPAAAPPKIAINANMKTRPTICLRVKGGRSTF